MKGELHITASGDLQLGNDVQGRGTEHLVFFVAQCLRRSNYDTVSGMNTYRVITFPTLSRITSYSISFQPAMQRSTRT